MNERKTDYFINRLLEEAGIRATPNGSDIEEIRVALGSASKRGKGPGYPEFVGISDGFVIVIEDKADTSKQAKYSEDGTELLMDKASVCDYAMNGALHYARAIVNGTGFDRVFAFGCSGDEKHHILTPMYVDANDYLILDSVENFENFSEGNIEDYYREQVLKETPPKVVEIEEIVDQAADLHEYLRNYGALGDKEKPLVVSAIMLALSDPTFDVSQLKGDSERTDGRIVFDTVNAYLSRVEVQPETKKEKILEQFSILKTRTALNQVRDNLGKTPMRFFTEFIRDKIQCHQWDTPEDVLGRFYGEFMRYTGGDGQELGVVLTPKHITTLFCDLLDVGPEDVVFDPCCGTGGFLIAAMHRMIGMASNKEETEDIKRNRVWGIEVRDDMFSIATTNMILRGDGKSNLICDDFFAKDAAELRQREFTVGLMNPPYSQGDRSNNYLLSEISFTEHLLDSMKRGGRVAVIVPQSTMIGKTKQEKTIKRTILEHHTLEGVITMGDHTFPGVGTSPCIAVFTAGKPHPPEKLCKFINFTDDGYELKIHVGLVETERAKERRQFLLSCWNNHATAESRFMILSKIKADDEWLHSYFYSNDEIPSDEDFRTSMADYLTFEFNMVVHGHGNLFGRSEGR